jgi:hypothetical protein
MLRKTPMTIFPSAWRDGVNHAVGVRVEGKNDSEERLAPGDTIARPSIHHGEGAAD